MAKVTKSNPNVLFEFWEKGRDIDDLKDAKSLLCRLVGQMGKGAFNFKSPWIKALIKQALNMLKGTVTFDDVV